MSIAAAYRELEKGSIATRICVSLNLRIRDAGSNSYTLRDYNFVRDIVPLTFSNVVFTPIGIGEIDQVSTRSGSFADQISIVLDGAQLLERDQSTTSKAMLFNALAASNLRKRPIRIFTAVLDIKTFNPVGLIPEFAGRVEEADLDRTDEANPVFNLRCVSYRRQIRQPIVRTLSDTDQSSIFPGDHSQKWAADTIFRGDTFVWNKEQAVPAASDIGPDAGTGVSRGPYLPYVAPDSILPP